TRGIPAGARRDPVVAARISGGRGSPAGGLGRALPGELPEVPGWAGDPDGAAARCGAAGGIGRGIPIVVGVAPGPGGCRGRATTAAGGATTCGPLPAGGIEGERDAGAGVGNGVCPSAGTVGALADGMAAGIDVARPRISFTLSRKVVVSHGLTRNESPPTERPRTPSASDAVPPR